MVGNDAIKNEIKVEQVNTDAQVNKTNSKLLVFVVVLVVLSIFLGLYYLTINNSTIKETDRSIENSEVEGNLYRNTKYNFRIRFPEGWEIKPGDGPSVLQKAVSGSKSIIVMVREGEIPDTYTIKDVASLEEFKDFVFEDIQKNDKDAKIIDYGETTLNNKPAYWIKQSANSSTLDINVKVLGTIYFVVHNGNTYVVTTSAAPEEYADTEKTFQKALVTFVFEDF